MSFFTELNRRNVIRMAAAYVIVGWLVLQVADVVLNNIDAPGWVFQVLLLFLALGLPFVIIFSWVYELTPDGLRKETDIPAAESISSGTAKKLDMVVIALLVVTSGLFIADRFFSTPEMPAAPAAGAAAVAEPKEVPVVAVLPLKALSTEDEGVFLASGLHDDLLTRLAKLAAFRVISRTSVMEYANSSKNLRQIGEELGAGYILEGGLQAIGGRVRINAQLIDAATDEHLWAETFDRPLTTANLFDVQAEIAKAIADALHAALSPHDEGVLSDVPTESLDAYRAYLDGKAHYESLSSPSIAASIDGARRAVELDSGFADAWALLSQSLIRKYWEEGGEYDVTPDEALRQAAREALQKAQTLHPNGVNTLVSTAFYRYYGFRDYSAALIVLGRAEAVAPHDEDVISLRGFLLRRLGRLSESADALMQAREVNPNSAGLYREAITTLSIAGRCPEAIDVATAALKRYPSDSGIMLAAAWNWLFCDNNVEDGLALVNAIQVTTFFELDRVVRFLIYANEFADAIGVLTESEQVWGDDPVMRLAVANQLAWLYRRTGQPDLADAAMRRAAEATRELLHVGASALAEMAMTAALRGDDEETLIVGRRTLETVPDDAYLRPIFRYQVIIAYAVAGLEDAALEQLEIMLSEAGGTAISPLAHDPYLENLWDDPQFKRMVAAARGEDPAR